MSWCYWNKNSAMIGLLSILVVVANVNNFAFALNDSVLKCRYSTVDCLDEVDNDIIALESDRLEDYQQLSLLNEQKKENNLKHNSLAQTNLEIQKKLGDFFEPKEKRKRNVYLDIDPRGIIDRSPRAPDDGKDEKDVHENLLGTRLVNRDQHFSGKCDEETGVCTLTRDQGDPTGRPQPLRAHTVQLDTPLGVVTGTRELSMPPTTQSARGRVFYAFRGIPYADPPVGDLRWKDPVLRTRRWGLLDATQYRSFCPQYDHDHKKVVGEEDCLYLNVYTPFLPHETNSRLPVLVFIHGGAYTRGGASSHGPERLMTENIVVVTINYRLGVFGFLSTGTESLAGNFGALDTVTALQWVSKFIENFNGDPTQVTLGGFSAGASLVHLHMMSSLSQGLFHRAIMMSGSGNCLWSVQPHPLEVAIHLAQDLECPEPPGTEFEDCVRNKSSDDLIEIQTARYKYVYWPIVYRPVIDAGLRENPFLSAPVNELMNRPPISSVPVLGGATQFEGLLFSLTTMLFSSNPSSPSQIHDEASLYLLGCLWPNETSRADVAATLHSFYYTPLAKESIDTLIEQMTESMTDKFVTSCLWDALEHLAATRIAPVYSYLMTHHDPSSPAFAHPLYRLAHDHGVRSPLLQSAASHGDDVILIFNFPHSQIQPGPRDLQMSTILVNMWANFIKTGSPVKGRISSGVPPWKPLSPGSPLTYYRLSLTPGSVTRPFRSKERNLWQQTLKVSEHISDQKSELGEDLWSFQLATWLLLVLCVLLLLTLLIICVAIFVSKRRKKYHARAATLRSNKPRNSGNYGGPNYSTGIAESS